MSDKEEKDTSKLVGNKIPVVITEGNALSFISPTSSQQNVPWPAVAEGSGDLGRILQEHLNKPDKPETKLTRMEVINTDVRKGSGDHTAKEKVGETSKSDMATKKVESSFPFLHKRDEIDLEKAGDLDEIEDEDMQLRWDDDDADVKNDDILSEDQLLEETSDVITKTCPDDEKRFEDELLKEPDLSTEAINSPEMDFDLLQESENLNTESINSPEMDFEKLSFLQETDLNAEAISSPEMYTSIDGTANQDDANFLESELLNESEIQEENQVKEILVEKNEVGKLEESATSSEIQVISKAKEFLGEMCIVENLEEYVSRENQVLAEAKEILEDKCITEEIVESEINSANLLIAQAKESLGEKSVVLKQEESEINSAKQVITLAKEILGEKSMDEEPEELKTENTMQIVDTPNKILEEITIVKEVEVKCAQQVIALAKEILGEKSMVEEPEQHKTDSAMQVIDKPKEILEEKIVVKEVEESEMNTAKQLIAEAAKILVEKSIVEAIKETGSVEINLLNEVTTDKHAKEVFKDIIKEDQLLEESQSSSQTEVATSKVHSFADVILSKINDADMLDKNLVKENPSKSERSATISEKGMESSIITPEKQFQMIKEDDVLLEDKLSKETETAEVMPERDVAMEVDYDIEGELLKDVEDDSCTPMDIDITDQSIEDKILDQKMDDPNEIPTDDTAHSIDHQTNKKQDDDDGSTEDVKNTDQSDDQVKTSEKVIDQPIEDATETIEVITETPEKVIDIAEAEKVNTDQVIDHENKIDDNKEHLTVETNITDDSTNNPAETAAIAVSSTPNVLTEDVEKTIQENISLETKTKDKIETEKPEEIYETVNQVDIKIVTDEVSPNNSSIFHPDSPGPIKTDHGLHRPDVMLEIPTQELIDMDDTDFSMHLDQSMISLNDVYENLDEVKELEKIVDEAVPDDDTVNEKSADQTVADDTVKVKPVDQKSVTEITIPSDDVTVNDKSVDQKAMVIETMAIDDDPANVISVNQKSSVTEIKIPSDDDTAAEISVDQKAEVIETITTDVVTVNVKSVNQKAVVSETTTIADDDKVIEKSVDQEAGVTKTIVSDDDTVNDESLDQKADINETAIPSDDVAVNVKSIDQEDEVTETIIHHSSSVDDVIANEISIDQNTEVTEIATPTADVTEKEKSVDLEAIVIVSTVSEVLKDGDVAENDKKAKDTVVEETIEDNLEKMFADDEPAVANEVPEPIASTSHAQHHTEQPPAPITQMTPDTADEVPDISDSLGLLAESSGRMIEDDEEPEDDDDEDDDFDNDESSNQISAEQSEDSNPAALDAETAVVQEGKDLETPDNKDTEDSEYPPMIMDEGGEFGTEPIEPTEPAEPMDIETVQLSDNEVDLELTEEQLPVAEPSKEGEEQHPKQSPSKSAAETSTSPKQSPSKTSQLAPSPSKSSPSKMDPTPAKTKIHPTNTQEDKPLKIKVLSSGNQEGRSVVNIVNLDESSSSEDDIEVQKQQELEATSNDKPPSPDREVTNVNIPTGIEIMCSGSAGSTSEITTKEGEVVISGVPKPPPHKPARLNTSEVSIKTVSAAEPMVIPETTMNDQAQTSTQSKPKLGLEIFSLDSDDEDSAAKEVTDPEENTAEELDKTRETSKCINYLCKSDGKAPYIVADAAVVAHYVAGKKSRSLVCQPCADVVTDRSKNLIQGIKDLTPLLQLEMKKLSQDLVEISDSESEDEDMTTDEPKETIGEKGAKFIEDNLTKFLNDTWKKYDMDVRLKETQLMLDDEIEKLEQDSKEIDAMLNECQVATDKLRNELYATFESRKQPLPPLIIYDTTDSQYIGVEEPNPPAEAEPEPTEIRQNKRRLSSTSDQMPAKRPAIPLGYAPLDAGENKEKAITISAVDPKMDDDKDISVVKLSAEAAPAELPPPGEISRPPLRLGMPVYAMKNAFGPWLKGRVLEIVPKNPSSGIQFSMCKVKFDHKKNNGKILPARCIAYSEPADVRMTIGTRLIAIFKNSNKRESFYSGVVAEIPNPVNNYRYLVFFDDGYAQYVQHQFTRLVCESSNLVWEEVHPFSRDFVKEYLLAYPERPMVRLHEGQHLKTEWNGKWWSSRVTRVDASLAQVMFVGDGRREWIYRGSTRLAPLYLELRAAERHRPRPMPRSKAQPRINMPYVEYTRSDEPEPIKLESAQTPRQQQLQIHNEEIRRQRAVAKKSTSAPAQVIPPSQQIVHSPTPTEHLPVGPHQVTSRVVYYTPKHAVRPLRMSPHRCSSKCKRSDVLSLKELRTYNPLAKPLLSGWERQIVRFKGNKEVMYRAPCGRRLRNMRELHQYLRMTESDFPVDLFDFSHGTHCLAEFVLNKCLVGKKDLSHGKENVPVPCVNYYDDSLPEFCSYNTERTPTAGVPLNLDPEFLCGCDCTDDCQDKTKCACWKMTLEGARTIGLTGPNVGYMYKRLPEPLPSGIYECNARCKCKHTCLNRVAQHPLQLKLQVFKTPNRGWGIRALNDVPKGSFLCVYAGNLLTDATANLDGLNEGDEYLAELDYIEVVEQMKEGYEEDIPETDKKLDRKESKNDDDTDEDEPSSSEEEDTASKTDKEDDDFRPGYIGLGVAEFNKRLRRREKSKRDKQNRPTDDKEKEKDTTKENTEDDCITISDDEEVREPSRFMAQTNMGANEYISKYKSVRTLFGKDEACYIMDAKVQGNIGRYLNHSCSPNVFVQNVFVDTHDPRFPWVAFFALCYIRAGTELTWNYNYDVGSVPGKVLYCHCGADNCRGRLL